MNSFIGLKNSFPELQMIQRYAISGRASRTSAERKSCTWGKKRMVNKVQVSPMACKFQQLEVSSRKTWRIGLTSKQKRYGTCEQVNSFICIHKVFSPETQKRGHVSQFCWDQKN